MGLSKARKLLLVLVITAYIFSGAAEAWSWSWSSSGSNSGSSSWGFGSSSDEIDTNWGWRSSSGPNHKSGNGSTHHSLTPPSNNSSSTGSTINNNHNQTTPSNHTAPSNNSTSSGSMPNNHTIPSNNSNSSGSTHNNHTIPSNHSSSTGSTQNNDHNQTVPISPRREIVVTVWNNGFDYQAWLSKHKPFYVNDVLVFKYNINQTQSKTKNNQNDVYLLQDLRSYIRCDVSRGKKLAGGASSSGRGFKLLLRKTQSYYFANGDHKDCNNDNMKFSLASIPRPSPN